MRHTGTLFVPRCGIQIEAERLTIDKIDRSVCESADAQLGPLQVGQNADRPTGLTLQFPQDGKARTVILRVAVAEIESKHVDPREKQPAQGVPIRACGPHSRDYFGVACSS